MKRTCFEIEVEFPIKLMQTGVDKFTVIYGKQVSENLNYAGAASELGASIMHGLSCQGKLDNRLEGEQKIID
jgi:hypothetical protein